MNRHLAELNIGRLLHPLDDPRIADFANNLELVNGIADRSEGFVWRLKGDAGNATSMQAFDDPRIIINISLWDSVEALERYVWQTVHKRFYGRRHEWFDRFEGPYFVMWWVPSGHRPTVQEALERLQSLKDNGPSDFAFGWESLPAAQMWKAARCA
jgi:Domain of unknown function (DUF3291)